MLVSLGDARVVVAQGSAEVNQRDPLLPPAAHAEEEPDGPNTGRITLGLYSDFATAYFFYRGILQERNGLMWQPSGTLGINVYQGEGLLNRVDLGFDIWASFHTAKTGASGSGPSNLYELDFIPSITFAWRGGLQTSFGYTFFTSPNGAFNEVQEFDVGVAYDDSDLLGPFALAPTLGFAFETHNTAFGDKQGGYLAIGAGPSLEWDGLSGAHGEYPVTFTLPLGIGLSLYDYYETETSNDTFGFFSFGLTGSVPLSFIPQDFGSWSVSAGIVVLVLSSTLKEVNLGDSPFPMGIGTLSVQY
jgi:hypothetical protein